MGKRTAQGRESQIPGVVLAGGRATRMGGGDKPLLPLAGRPMLAHLLDRLAPQCTPLALNANGDPARFAAFGLPVLADSLPGHPGPLAGILAAMDWAAAQGAAQVVTVAGDTPFLPEDLVPRLCAAQGASGLAIAATCVDGGAPRLHPTAGLWPVTLRTDLRTALAAGTRKVAAWAEAQEAGLALFDAGAEDPFFNINRPEDLADAARRIAQGR